MTLPHLSAFPSTKPSGEGDACFLPSPPCSSEMTSTYRIDQRVGAVHIAVRGGVLGQL